ncbi:hypothetical protein DAEQUDRAFT_732651 [Daedalea quercina L-15889]|uniref:DUF6697 domain-containing protein n=1 Tax=Daedalea quercina L-15889 TaxID=1314783 RepID=A0A165LHD9_9APHY|nr:hypothetical protein DAEQUDRAFT_732651 [Daedalea quercina L-15889]
MSDSEESASEGGSENDDIDPDNQSHDRDYETDDDDPEMLALADMTIRDFEVHEFLQVKPDNVVPDMDSLFDGSFVSVSGKKVWQTTLQESINCARHSPRTRKCSTDTTIWMPYEDLSRCILVYPAQGYNFMKSRPIPVQRKHSKEWPQVGDMQELCYSANASWYYCGTYKCVGMSVLRLDELCKLEETKFARIFDTLVQRTPTQGSKSTIKTRGSLANAIRDMYRDGTLHTRCYGLQLVGYDNEIKAAFIKAGSSMEEKKGRKRTREVSRKKGSRNKKRQRLP